MRRMLRPSEPVVKAFDTVLLQADMAGADAVIGIRCDANEMMPGVKEMVCYGTAVQVKSTED